MATWPGRLLNPAMHSVNSGVRGYYFALAAAAWLFGPIPFIAATLGAVGLLVWRQRRSPAAYAIADLRKLLEAMPPAPPGEIAGRLSNPAADARLSRDAALRVGQVWRNGRGPTPCNTCC